MKKFNKVFLGGTCNNSTWREALIPFLKIDYFNPVVKDWTPECQEEEYRQKELCDCHLYVITPKMTGAFSIAEVVDSSNKCPEKTVFMIMSRDMEDSFTEGQLKSLKAVACMVQKNGGQCYYDLPWLMCGHLNSEIVAAPEFGQMRKQKIFQNI